MGVEVRARGTDCDLACTYCYENDIRTRTPRHAYNREAVLKAIEKTDSPFTLFGGEPLLLPLKDLDELLGLAFKRHGSSGMQTNGVRISPEHIEMFKKYRTHIGISLDGPVELNDGRWAGTQETTRIKSERTHWSIRTLCEAAKTCRSLLPSLIVTLHAGNVSKEHFPTFVKWLYELDVMGIQCINAHVMELDSKADTLYLPQEELADRLIDLWNEQDHWENLRITKFAEVLKLMQGADDVVCTWRMCDPHNTSAVQGIEGDGSPSLCSRVHKDGVNWLPAEGSGHAADFIGHPGKRYHERQLALYVTPQENGGCKGCEYFLACGGQCPGEGEDGDWRRRTHYCYTYKRLFEEASKRLRAVGIKPLGDWKHRPELEQQMYNLWTTGQSPTLGAITKEYKEHTTLGHVPVPGGWHGDHQDG